MEQLLILLRLAAQVNTSLAYISVLAVELQDLIERVQRGEKITDAEVDASLAKAQAAADKWK